MSNPGRIAIVVGLVVLVSGVLAIKQRESPVAPPDAVISSPERSLPRLVDLGASQCIPCKMMMPVLDELKQQYTGQLEVQFIDVLEQQELAAPHSVSVIPTQIFFDVAGQELFRHEGFFAKEDILAKWRELGFNLEPGDAIAEPNTPAR